MRWGFMEFRIKMPVTLLVTPAWMMCRSPLSLRFRSHYSGSNPVYSSKKQDLDLIHDSAFSYL